MFLQCLRTCNNALFLMASGALLLGKQETIKRIVIHRISRIVIGLVLFSLLYEFYYGNYEGIFPFFVKVFSTNVISPFWFLYYYIGYLMILPFLRAIAKSVTQNQMRYLVALAIIYNTVFPMLKAFTGFPMPYVPFLFGDFILMPLFGYYFHKSETSNKEILMWGLVFLVTEVLSCIAVFRQMKQLGSYTQDYIALGSYPTAIFMFVLLKKIIHNRSVRSNIFMSTTFGIYYFAPFLQDKLLCVYKTLVPSISTIPAFCIFILCVMGCASIITIVLKQIPLVKKLF